MRPLQPTRLAPAALLRPLPRAAREALATSHDATVRLLTDALGPPYYARDGFILYQGDCLEILARLARSSVRFDLAVTSPPYNIGKAYERPLDLERYVDWCAAWLDRLHGIGSERASFWLNLGYLAVPDKGRAVPIPYLLWDKSPFYLVQEVVWQYGAGVATRRSFSPRNEKWLFYVRDPASYTFNLDPVRDPDVKYPHQKKHGKLRCNPLGKNPSDVWQCPKVTTGKSRSSRERSGHPAQFPLALVERIVLASSNPLDLVLDPFAGSATTGIAAIGRGRRFIGLELREDYCALAASRFERYLAERERS